MSTDPSDQQRVTITLRAAHGGVGAAGPRVPADRRITDLVRPTTTLCVTAGNDAAWIGRCLASAQSVVDETVVVTVGSTDRTAEIARRAGATVIEGRAPDGHAERSNLPIEYARGDWILSLRADEVLDNAPRSRWPSLGEIDADGVQFGVRVYAFGLTLKWRRADPRASISRGAAGWTPREDVRLFRRGPGIRFRGRVDPTVRPAIEAAGGRIARTDVVVHAYPLAASPCHRDGQAHCRRLRQRRWRVRAGLDRSGPRSAREGQNRRGPGQLRAGVRRDSRSRCRVPSGLRLSRRAGNRLPSPRDCDRRQSRRLVVLLRLRRRAGATRARPRASRRRAGGDRPQPRSDRAASRQSGRVAPPGGSPDRGRTARRGGAADRTGPRARSLAFGVLVAAGRTRSPLPQDHRGQAVSRARPRVRPDRGVGTAGTRRDRSCRASGHRHRSDQVSRERRAPRAGRSRERHRHAGRRRRPRGR